jgi:hypothetical protein
MAEKACGKHSEISSNEHVRITQCTCGTVHVTFIKNGVTLRMNEDGLRQATRSMMLAVDHVDESVRVRIN